MIAFPNAKINIGLNILGKRPDGYHNIYSCYYPVPWCDVLEIIEGEKLEFHPSGINIPGKGSENLCLKACKLLSRDFDLPPVRIYLYKTIPIGAGLGGGSADAAFTLKLLNDTYELKITIEQLELYAAQLGSDCPFFIRNEPAIATETGQNLKKVDIDLSGLYVVLVNPAIHISTAEAYTNVSISDPPSIGNEIFSRSQISSWKEMLHNDFEAKLIKTHQVLSTIKNSLYELGAYYASMTGSGSTIYGIFTNKVEVTPLQNLGYTVYQDQLKRL